MSVSLCYKCFHEYVGSGPCPYCGYDPAQDAGKYPLVLKGGSILGGRYIVGRVLGQGGFGVTYSAQDYNNKKLVAIKEHFPAAIVTRVGPLSVQLISENMKENFLEGKQNFLNEARTLSQFNGLPNICDIYSYFEENGTAYFAMEYVDGIPLDKYILRLGRTLSFEEALRLMLPVMKALSHVHAAGIIHRDLAPDNIMVTPGGGAMLIDFGAARYSMGEKSRSLDVILKHGFAPREQYARHGRQGAYTDVYALAATFYYAITGKVPPDAIDRTQEDELVLPSKLGVKIPHKAEQVLLKALAVDFKQRFQTMDEFMQKMSVFLPDVKKEEEARRAAERKAEEERKAAQRKAEAEKREAERKAAEEKRLAEKKALEEKREAERKAKEEQKAREAAKRAQAQKAKEQKKSEKLEKANKPAEKQTPKKKTSIALIAALAAVAAIAVGVFAMGGDKKESPVVSEVPVVSEAPVVESAAPEVSETPAPTKKPAPAVLSWLLTDDGTLTISGEGAMRDYNHNTETPWYSASSSFKARKLVITEGITHIGSNSFGYHTELEEVVLPESLKSIGARAFDNCASLRSIEIPAGVDTLKAGIFKDCIGLGEVVLPPDITNIGTELFRGCTSLRTIVVPEGVTVIGQNAFDGCSSLYSITLPVSLETVIDNAFGGGPNAFGPCRSLSYVEYMGSEQQWENIEIEKNNDPLLKATLNCALIAGGSAGENVSWSLSKDGTLTISGEGAMDLAAPWKENANEIRSLVIEEGITRISTSAFHECRNLSEVSLPKSLERIGPGAFHACSSLRNIKLHQGITYIGDYAFQGSGLTEISIPSSVTYLGVAAFFECRSLSTVNIAEGLELIGMTAFRGCYSLSSISIPESVTNIGYFAFKDCSSLYTVDYAGTAEQWNAIKISGDNDTLLNASISFKQ